MLTALHPTVEVEGTSVRATFHPQPEHRGIQGLLHGGLAATVLDHVCARAAAASLGARVMTGRLDVRYRRPVALDEGPYQVDAAVESARGRRARVRGAIRDIDGRPLVEAQGLFLAVPEART